MALGGLELRTLGSGLLAQGSQDLRALISRALALGALRLANPGTKGLGLQRRRLPPAQAAIGRLQPQQPAALLHQGPLGRHQLAGQAKGEGAPGQLKLVVH